MRHFHSKSITLMAVLLIQINAIAQVSGKIRLEAKNQTTYALDLCKSLHANPELPFPWKKKQVCHLQAEKKRLIAMEI
jgi:hypothetical protein